MKRIQTLETRDLAKSLKTGGCGECQTSPASLPARPPAALPTSSARIPIAENADTRGKLPPDRARSSGTFFIRRK